MVALTEGRLPYPPLSTVGVVPDPEGAPVVGHLEHSHHLAKRAPQRYYGYRGYNRGYRSRGGGGNNRGRTAVLFGKTVLTAANSDSEQENLLFSKPNISLKTRKTLKTRS